MKKLIRSQFWVIVNFFIWIKELIWKTGWKKSFNIKILKDVNIKLVAEGEISKICYSTSILTNFNKGFEYQTLIKFDSYLRQATTVLDIGANVGVFSVFAAKRSKNDCRVYSFEPSSETFRILEKNIELNGVGDKVSLFKLALSNVTEKVKFGRDLAHDDAYNHIITSNESGVEVFDVVNTQRLDEFLNSKGISRVDLIKIDVEGAEFLVFEGAQMILSGQHKPVIIFECYEDWSERYSRSVSDTLFLLYNYGYSVKQYDSYQWVATPNL